MRKIRSQKWAAFRLGYLSRILRSVLGSVFEELAPIRDAGACFRQMEEAVFLLIGHLSETELAEYRRLAERTQTLYERAFLDKFAPQEAVGKYLEYYHEHLHVLCFRSVEKRADLSGWFGVAEAIADMQCRLIFDREELDPSTIYSRFERAFIGLNGRDRELAEGFTNEVRTGATEGLEYRLCDSYGDLSQVLSGRNAEGIECSQLQSPCTEQSIFVEEIEGFAHNADFSICKVSGRIFQVSGAMRLIVHAIYALRYEGVLKPKWPTMIEKARLLYQDQRPLLVLLHNAEDKRPDKEFKRQGIWRTVVKPNSTPKGSYSLILQAGQVHERPQEIARKGGDHIG